jgi:hypothetical protein
MTLLLGVAGLIWVLSGCGGPSTLNPVSAASGQSAASSMPAGPLDFRLVELRADLAAHPTWPQRQITMQDGLLLLPYGASDAKDYLAWIIQLGHRYDGGIRRTYVQDTPGAPAPAELEVIKDRVARDLRELHADFAYSLLVMLEHGRVELEYQPTIDYQRRVSLPRGPLGGQLRQPVPRPSDPRLPANTRRASQRRSSSGSTVGQHD